MWDGVWRCGGCSIPGWGGYYPWQVLVMNYAFILTFHRPQGRLIPNNLDKRIFDGYLLYYGSGLYSFSGDFGPYG